MSEQATSFTHFSLTRTIPSPLSGRGIKIKKSMSNTLFADVIIEQAKNELKKFITFESELVYSLDSSKALNVTDIDKLSIIELADLARDIEKRYYDALKKH